MTRPEIGHEKHQRQITKKQQGQQNPFPGKLYIPTVFPTVTLFELDNRTDRERNSTSDFEDFSLLAYEAHIYATSKAKCREVFKALDEALARYNFNRFSGAYTPNLTNSQVHEYVARYQVRVSNDGCLSRVN